jgi:hypothetical protein
VVDRTLEAREKVDWRLGIRAVHPKKVDETLYRDMTKELSRLSSSGVEYVVEETGGHGGSYTGAGATLYGNLFGHFMTHMADRENIVAMSMDGDQFFINDENYLNALSHMSQRMRAQKQVYGMGGRTHVTLNADPVNDRKRKIHELVYSSLITHKLDFQNPSSLDLFFLDKEAPGYRRFGEVSPGIYAINYFEDSSLDLLRKCFMATKVADFSGFAADYYMSIAAGDLGVGINHTYVPTNPMQPQTKRDVDGLITEQTHELFKTDIGNKLRFKLENPDTKKTLSEYYPAEEVDYVVGLMRKA